MPDGCLTARLLLGAVALAWAIERPQKPAPPVMETYPTGWTVDPQADPPPAGIFRMRWPWWRAVLVETYEAMSKDRLLAVAAGVVFYGAARDLPGDHALWCRPTACSPTRARSRTTCRFSPMCCRPAASSIIQEQIARIAGTAERAQRRLRRRALLSRCGAPTPASRR